jgi:hypothetical protein
MTFMARLTPLKKHYACAMCGATKTIDLHGLPEEQRTLNQFPERIVCGWRGCQGWAFPIEVLNGSRPRR